MDPAGSTPVPPHKRTHYLAVASWLLLTPAHSPAEDSELDLFRLNQICTAAEYPDEASREKSLTQGYPLTIAIYPNSDIGDRPRAITESLRGQGISTECIIGRYASGSGRTEYAFYARGDAIKASDGEIYHSFEEIMGDQGYRDLIKGKAIVAQSDTGTLKK